MTTRDDDLLNEIEAALDVAPPPGFESRVRRRVLEVDEQRWQPWMSAALGVAAVLMIAFVVLPARTAPVSDRPIAANIGRTELPQRTLAPAEPRLVEPGRPESPGRLRAGLPTTRRRPTVAEVMVPADEARRFQAFVNAVAAGQVVMVAPRPAPSPDMPSLPLAPTSPVVIHAMVTRPLSEDLSRTEWR